MKHLVQVLTILICVIFFSGCKDSSEPSESNQPAQSNVSEANDLSSRESTADVASGETQPSADVQLLATVRATVKTYVDAGLAGNQTALAEVCVPGSAVAQQATTDLPGIKGVADLELVEVRADKGTAFAVSTKIPGDRGETGVLVFTIIRNAAGKWQIDDIDLKDPTGLSNERQRFTDQHPAAKVILQKNE